MRCLLGASYVIDLSVTKNGGATLEFGQLVLSSYGTVFAMYNTSWRRILVLADVSILYPVAADTGE